MTVVRQPVFPASANATGEARTFGPNARNTNRADGQPPVPGRVDPNVQAKVATQTRPLRLPTDPNSKRTGSGGTEVGALAARIQGMSDGEIRDAVRNIERKARRSQLPSDSVLRLLGPYAEPAQYERASMFGGQRAQYVHLGHLNKSGGNSPLAGRPFVFQGEAYSARAQFNPRNSDIPAAWAQQMSSGMNRARLNSDKPYNEDLLFSGRYNRVRV